MAAGGHQAISASGNQSNGDLSRAAFEINRTREGGQLEGGHLNGTQMARGTRLSAPGRSPAFDWRQVRPGILTETVSWHIDCKAIANFYSARLVAERPIRQNPGPPIRTLQQPKEVRHDDPKTSSFGVKPGGCLAIGCH